MISMHFEKEGKMGIVAWGKLGSEVVCQYTCSNCKGPVQGLCPDEAAGSNNRGVPYSTGFNHEFSVPVVVPVRI